MFENLIGQEAAAARLREDIVRNALPASILFSGPEYSGKITAALETARVLTCREQADWGCACGACARQRLLLHPDLALVGGRYFHEEIAACADTLRRSPREATRYLLVRAVRKLIRRFDSQLWEGEENRIQKASAHVAVLEDEIGVIEPGRELPADARLEACLERILNAAGKAVEAVNLDLITVHLVRRLAAWAHLAGAGPRKVIVIENADRMNDSARNALLKMLEEPPAGVNFILTSTRRGAIVPTVLSRVRTYVFSARGEAEARQVLQRIFRDDSGEWRSLKDFFMLFREINPAALRAAVQHFLDCALSAQPGCRDFAAALPADHADLFAERAKFKLFLRELLELVREGFERPDPAPAAPGGRPSLAALEDLRDLVRRSYESCEVYNVSPPLLAERLFAALGRSA
jgi:DNA polymerase III delta prime subunit